MAIETKVIKIEKVVEKKAELPDGFYKAYWGGYKVRLDYNGDYYELTTEDGVRGVNILVTVHVEGKNVAVLSQVIQN